MTTNMMTVFGVEVVKTHWMELRDKMSRFKSAGYMGHRLVDDAFILMYDEETQKYTADGWQNFALVCQRMGFMVTDDRPKHRVLFQRFDW